MPNNRNVKIVHEARTVDAEEFAFTAVQNTSAVYHLDDGTIIELTHEAGAIYRLCDVRTADGKPIYVVTGKAQVWVTPVEADAEGKKPSAQPAP